MIRTVPAPFTPSLHPLTRSIPLKRHSSQIWWAGSARGKHHPGPVGRGCWLMAGLMLMMITINIHHHHHHHHYYLSYVDTKKMIWRWIMTDTFWLWLLIMTDHISDIVWRIAKLWLPTSCQAGWSSKKKAAANTPWGRTIGWDQLLCCVTFQRMLCWVTCSARSHQPNWYMGL